MPDTQPYPEPSADPLAAASLRGAPDDARDAAHVHLSATDSPTHAERGLAVGQFDIRAERRGNDHVLALFGELDVANALRVEAELQSAEATDADQIFLDLCGLDFIDSTGLRLILNANARSQDNGRRLRLLPGPPQVQRIFEITATTDLLPFTDR